MPAARHVRKHAGQAGFSLVEVLVGGALLALALLGHAATTLVEHRNATTQQTRSEVLQAMRQFMERLRSEEDWEYLYSTLRTYQTTQTGYPEPLLLEDGRVAHAPTTYFYDFVQSPELGVFLARVDVPASRPDPDLSASDPDVLREDVTDPRFGLPFDLDGDGVIDSTARDTDYVVLPVLVTFHWRPTQGTVRERTIATWLRGNR